MLSALKEMCDEEGIKHEVNATAEDLYTILMPSPSDLSLNARIIRDKLQHLCGLYVDKDYLSPQKSIVCSKLPPIIQKRRKTFRNSRFRRLNL